MNSKPEKRIDFICIGAAKSGTTWLYHHLKSHPNIELGKVKEINYFNKYEPENPNVLNSNYKKSVDYYHSFFPQVADKTLLGEFSTSYLKQDNCALDLFEYNPKLKLIVLLRNPVERLYSHYLFLVQRGMVPPSMSFEETIAQRKYMMLNGMYFKQLTPYYQLFPEEQINVLWYDDLSTNASQLFAEVLSFLNVEFNQPSDLSKVVNPTLEVKNERLNETVIALSVKLNRGMTPLFKSLVRKLRVKTALNKLFILNTTHRPGNKPTINPDTRKRLLKYYQIDIEHLEVLLKKDLSHWKS